MAVAEPRPAPAPDLHREDRWAWSVGQLEALQRRDASLLDWDNLILEVRGLQDDMASGLRKYCARIVEHMLKVLHARNANSFLTWENSYLLHRGHAIDEIKGEIGLLENVDEIFQRGWAKGRRDAIEALGGYELEGREGDYEAHEARDALVAELEGKIPERCPWTVREILGCDPRKGEFTPGKAVIPAEIKTRLCGEGVTVPHTDGRPLKAELLERRAEERGGRWKGLEPEVGAGKDSAEQSSSMAELARRSAGRGGGGRGR